MSPQHDTFLLDYASSITSVKMLLLIKSLHVGKINLAPAN